jgi:predicted DNA-binding transcriptional regulator AlpA
MATIPAHLHPEQLLTTEQVATLTGISRPTFEGWRCRKDGGPQYKKLGPQIIRYRWADVQAWMNAGTIVPTA